MALKIVSHDTSDLAQALTEVQELTGSEMIPRVIQFCLLSKQMGKMVPSPRTTWSIDGFQVSVTNCYKEILKGDGFTSLDVVIEPYDMGTVKPPEPESEVDKLSRQVIEKESIIAGIDGLIASTESAKTPNAARLADLDKQIKKSDDEHRVLELQEAKLEWQEKMDALEDDIIKLNQSREHESSLLAIISKNLSDEKKKVPKVNIANTIPKPDYPLVYTIAYK